MAEMQVDISVYRVALMTGEFFGLGIAQVNVHIDLAKRFLSRCRAAGRR